MSLLETEFLSLVGVFTGVAEVCASLLGLFEESAASEAGVICKEPLDLLLSAEVLLGGRLGDKDGKE